MTSFDLDGFVGKLIDASRGANPAQEVRKLMDAAFADPQAVKAATPEFAEDDVILFEDDKVSIWHCRFQPGLHVPPHDHQTPAIIGLYEGTERNSFYEVDGDRLVLKGSKESKPGDVLAIGSEGIHSVEAVGDVPCIGIHVYLSCLTTIERSLFDWESGAAMPFTDDNYGKMKKVG
jgi:predicted metal-dependent enzyme (double-stranded beta helix superfamily)